MSAPRNVFRRLRASARLGIWIEGAGVLAFAFAVFVLVSFAADRMLRLEAGYRLVLLLGLAVVLARILHTRVLTPLGVELNDEEMALAVERADPGVRQALISAIQFEDQLATGASLPESRQLMTAVVEDVEQRVEQLGLERALDRGRVRQFGALLLGCLVLPVAWVALDSETARLWAARNLALSTEEWPRDTLLTFAGSTDDGVLRVPEGDDQTVLVRAGGVVPEQVFLYYEFAGGATGVEAMTLTGNDEFTFTMQALLEGVEIHAEGGDGRTPSLRIEIVERPRVEDLEVALIYPEYMGREPSVVAETEGDIRVPRGGKLRVRGRTTKDLESASLVFGQDQRVALQLDATRRVLSGTFEPAETGVLTLNVVDQDLLDSARPPRLFLRLVEDRAPKVDFQPRGIGSMISPYAVLPGRLSVEDDYGLLSVKAWYRVTGVPEGSSKAADPAVETDSVEDVPWEKAEVTGLTSFTERAVEYAEQTAFDLLPLDPDDNPMSENNKARPGQMLSLRFTATDNFGPGAAHTGESDAIVFRVVTREKLLADLTRRQIEQRREIEQILAEEQADVAELREILSPTAEDPRATRAKLRVLALARKQRALGKRVRNTADHFSQILDELLNNRLFEPSKVAELRGQISIPLERLAAEEFPSSALAVAAFAAAGQDDVRQVVVLSYETIIARLQQLLKHMDEMENFAALLEALRRVIKLQDSAIHETEQRRTDAAGSLFDPPAKSGGKQKPPPRQDDKNKNKNEKDPEDVK